MSSSYSSLHRNPLLGVEMASTDEPLRELADRGEAGHSIDEREEAMLVGAKHGVALQVAGAGAVLGFCGSLGDRSLSSQAAPRVIMPVAFTPFLLGTAEMAMEGAVAALVGPDMPIDGLVTDAKQSEPAEPSADLFGAEVLP